MKDKVCWIEIKGDYNDADYVTESFEASAKTEALVRKVCTAIKTSMETQRWQNWDEDNRQARYVEPGLLTIEEVEWFNGLVPCGPDPSEVHTIESVIISPIVDREKLL